MTNPTGSTMEFYLLFVSQKINKLCQSYTKTNICKIFYTICSIKQIIFNKYAPNLKTSISQRSLSRLRNLSLFLLLFDFNNFSFLIDKIDIIIYASDVTRTSINGSAILLSCVSVCITWPVTLEGVLVTWYGRSTYIYTFWYNFDTVWCQFLETGTSD